ncbi:MAG: hypothetical protein CM1200mP10_29600 [Candidatus Neomarinimicrobiota bacterium]|nr:MAG: hypothetical protein CM1200mP10_29600 [Candidatus Neomarinimicrobiota bacterium]
MIVVLANRMPSGSNFEESEVLRNGVNTQKLITNGLGKNSPVKLYFKILSYGCLYQQPFFFSQQ